MDMENIILGLIGLGCVWYLARKFLRTAKGESGCGCGCGGCSDEKKGCDSQSKPDDKIQ
ncbi:MAG: FeoB-associated Cys-rich membrane protein [Sporomusaceae bacterium]|nr:FeoB-associated Cys-rich membrane protein [Sporomusaceae bacterium]